jgi:hypothetical protein
MPLIAARVEKRNNFIAERVNACEVRPFSQVAAMARERQIGGFIRTTVLLGNYVFDMVSEVTLHLAE